MHHVYKKLYAFVIPTLESAKKKQKQNNSLETYSRTVGINWTGIRKHFQVVRQNANKWKPITIITHKYNENIILNRYLPNII